MKAIAILSFLATYTLLAGCSTLNRTQPPVSQTQSDTEISTTSGELKSETTEATIDSNEAEPVDSEKLSAPIVDQAPIDLWNRIRNNYQLPIFEHELVTHYEQWNSKHKDYLFKMFERSQEYLFHIVEEIEKRQLPMELALLPAIESAYNAKAYSRSKASGLWQFIPSTGRYLGMRQDWWADQRRDIIQSTDSALDYLTHLHQEFDGDWILAIAAYNAGKGTIRKAMRRNRNKGLATDFASLKLRRETTRYVPKLIALANAVKEPEQFGIKLPEIDNTPYFVVQPIKGQIDLNRLIKNTDLQRSDIATLNPAFLRWATSPDGPHRLLIPLHHHASVLAYLDSQPEQPQMQWKQHRLKKGDTLSGLAAKYNVNTNAIRTINHMRNDRLRAGKDILIPIVTPVARQSDVAKARNSSSKPKSQQAKTVHQVKRGDTLWRIARNYQVAVADLLSWNNLSDNSVLSLNQTLVIFNRN